MIRFCLHQAIRLMRSTLFIALATVGFLWNCRPTAQQPTPETSAPDSWRQLADVPAGKPLLVAALNGKIYIGTSANTEVSKQDMLTKLWEFDPADRRLTARQDFTGQPVRDFTYFTQGGKLFVGLGQGDGTSGLIYGYSPDFFAYDPQHNAWQNIASVQKSGVPNVLIGARANGLNFRDRGLVLHGTYKANTPTTFENSGGATYRPADGWKPVTEKLFGTTPYPTEPASLVQYNQAYVETTRWGGFACTLNDRIYIGGGSLPSPSRWGGYQPSQDYTTYLGSRIMWEYTVPEPDAPTGLTMVLNARLETPSGDYNLSGSRESFALKNKLYIITLAGDVLTFDGATKRWDKLTNLPGPVLAGVALGEKAYFLTANAIVDYTPK